MKVIITDKKGVKVYDRVNDEPVTREYAFGDIAEKENDSTTEQWIKAGIAEEVKDEKTKPVKVNE